MRFKMTASLSIILLSIFGCENHEVQPPPPPPQAVKTTPVTRAGSARELRLSGTLEAERSLSLGFGTIGTVEQVLVQEGEAVAGGQALARISPRSYEDALGMMKAKADQAEDAYKRLEPMHKNQTVPDVKFVEVETGLQQARLAVSMAKKNLEDTVLRAPEPGIVARRQVEPGSSVTPGIPAIILVQTKTMFATASVPEKQLALVHKGDTARVTVPALGKKYDGVVKIIGVMADPLTRTYTVKVAITNPGELRVGMVTDTSLKVENASGDLVVPPEAIRVDEAGNPFVFIVTPENRIQLRRIEVLGFVGEGTAVSKGVSEGEMVVISGTPMLSDGMAVRIAGQVGKGK